MGELLRRISPLFFIGPTILLLVVVFMFPFTFAIYLSVHKYYLMGMRFDEIVFVGGANYVKILTDKLFLSITLPITFIYTTTVVVVEFLLGLGLAVLASQKLKFLRPFRIIFIMPVLMPSIAVGYVWRYMFEPNIGIINSLLRISGLGRGSYWYSGRETALLSIMIVDIWQWTPFVFLILMAGMFAMPAEPFEAAAIDGAGRWMRFRYITMRIMRRIIVLVVLLRLMDALKMIDVVYVLTYGGPAQATEGFVFAILKTSFQIFDIGASTAMSIILLLILNVVAQIAFRFFRWD